MLSVHRAVFGECLLCFGAAQLPGHVPSGAEGTCATRSRGYLCHLEQRGPVPTGTEVTCATRSRGDLCHQEQRGPVPTGTEVTCVTRSRENLCHQEQVILVGMDASSTGCPWRWMLLRMSAHRLPELVML